MKATYWSFAGQTGRFEAILTVEKVISMNLIKEYNDNCPDLEASYCCEQAITSCPAEASWSEWSSIGKTIQTCDLLNKRLILNVQDNNGGDGGDFELISQHREKNPKICQKPKAIDYKTQRNCFPFQLTSPIGVD